MALERIRDALLSVTAATYHFIAPKQRAEKYIVWGERRTSAFAADDAPDALVVSGELYYYTREEYDETVNAIGEAMSAAGASWRITDIGYDTELRQIIYAMDWEVPCGNGEIY